MTDHLPQLMSLTGEDDDLRVEFNPQLVERFSLFRQVFLRHATRLPRFTVRVSYVSKATSGANAKVHAKAARLQASVSTAGASRRCSLTAGHAFEMFARG